MAETLAYNFVGNDELSRVFEALDRVAGKLERTFDQLGDRASQAGRKMGTAGTEAKGAGGELDGLGEDAAKASRKIDELGGDMDKTAVKAAVFDAQIRAARRSVRQLTDEFIKTGDVDVLKKLSDKQGSIAEMEKALKHLTTGAEQAGREVGKNLSAGMQGSLSTPVLGPALIATLVGAAIVAAPAVGAAIGSAVTVGVGGGALAAGVLLAAKDRRVADAWHEFGNSAKDELTSAAGVFVAPLISSTRIFRGAFAEIMPGIRGDFAGLAPLVERLSSGVAGFVTNAMPGVNRLVDAAGPFIQDLADELPNIGNAMSDFFSSLSAGGPGAKQFFHDLLVFTEKTVVAVGNVVEFLSKSYALMSGMASIMTGDMTGALRIMDQFGDHGATNMHTFRNAAAAMFQTVHPGFDELQRRLSQTAITADTLAGQMTDKLMGSLLGMGHATLGVAESLTSIKDTFDQNGRAIDKHTGLVAMNTQAGQRNREAVLSAVESNLRMYDTQIQTGVSAADATAKYEENTKALHDQLRQAGLTEAQVHDLIGEYGNVPAKVNTEIVMKGLTSAIHSLDDAIRLANHLDGRQVTTYIDTIHRNLFTDPTGHFGGGGPPPNPDWGKAYGGRVGKRAMGGYYDVGENGPERVVLPDDAYVIPNNQMTRGTAGGGGGSDEIIGTLRVDFHGVDGAYIQSQLVSLARQRGHRTVAQLLPVGS